MFPPCGQLARRAAILQKEEEATCGPRFAKPNQNHSRLNLPLKDTSVSEVRNLQDCTSPKTIQSCRATRVLVANQIARRNQGGHMRCYKPREGNAKRGVSDSGSDLGF